MPSSSFFTSPHWKLNVLNLVSFIVNVTVTYLSLTGIFGATNTELSLKYQTLVTPAGWAFSIWGPIFIWEGLFAVLQLLPSLRGSEVIEAIGPFWAATSVFQIAWSITFAQDLVIVSLVFMLLILASLVALCYRVYRIDNSSIKEFLALKGPFFLQLGWIICASFVNINVVADARIPSVTGSGMLLANGTITGGDGTSALNPAYFADSNTTILLAVAVLSLAALFLTGTLVAVLPDRIDGNVIICGVIAWALGGVAAMLRDPVAKTTEMFGSVVTNALSGASAVLSITMVVMVVALAAKRIYTDGCGVRTVTRTDAERRNSQRDLSQKLEEGATGPIRA